MLVYFKPRIEKIKDSLEVTKLIQKAKKLDSNEAMHKLFSPTIMPAFISSFVSMKLPKGAKLIDSYKNKNSKIKIYELPEMPEK